MSLLDEARKPQERKQADASIGSSRDTKGDAYEATFDSVFYKPSDYPSQTGEEVMNLYVTATMDDGQTLLVCGQTKILREELAAAIDSGQLRKGVRFAVAFHGEGPKKPGRKPVRYYRLLVDAPPAKGSTPDGTNTDTATADDPPF